ncbi:hypothetical protein [Aquitalea pelogenes]|uniref:hypothetical protein n=1 Tax=Aquitalea pelogenes TaxID=1293573 RepID=UPI000A5447CA|nr:hypothetical protein [Aquitalea pelogenes]
MAISFVCADNAAHFRLIEKRQQLQLERERITGFEPQDAPASTPLVDGNGGIKGKRMSKKDKLRAAQAAQS